MIRLHQMPISHYCEKVRWVLAYRDIAHECINYLPGLHIKPVRKLSGQSSVPVIEDDGQVIAGSAHILDHLDDRYPDRPLLPDNPEQQQQCREWERHADLEIGPPVRLLAYHVLLEFPDTVIPFLCHDGPWYGRLFLKATHKKLFARMRAFMKINEENAGPALQQLNAAVSKLTSSLNSSGYLVGESFSRADLSCAALLAPLAVPDGYGLDWPEDIPEPMLQLMDRYSDAIEWTRGIYARHR